MEVGLFHNYFIYTFHFNYINFLIVDFLYLSTRISINIYILLNLADIIRNTTQTPTINTQHDPASPHAPLT